jgi:alpha-1,3/alpha-1,6-mannosyltransferase
MVRYSLRFLFQLHSNARYIGTLDVRVRGSTIIPPSIFGRLAILCAILRQIHLVLAIALFSFELTDLEPTAFFIDQLSACTPLLRFLDYWGLIKQNTPKSKPTPVLFYCHYPDKLLARGREGLLKQIYRFPFDELESWSTGCADRIVVNSFFTKGVFGKAFEGLKDRNVGVVYPCVDTKERKKGGVKLEKGTGTGLEGILGRKVILSINRFEKKKDIGLAVKAFAGLNKEERSKSRLVIAGGYDSRVKENVSYHQELIELAESLDLKTATTKNFITSLSIPADTDVLFLLSIPATLKSSLLSAAALLVYTPSNEHFGIVPLEAMLAGTPVLAATSGGPLETIVDEKTGWLRSTKKPEQWTEVIRRSLFVLSPEELAQISQAGKQRVKSEFSEKKMAERLEKEITEMVAGPRQRLVSENEIGVIFMLVSISVTLAIMGGTLLYVKRRQDAGLCKANY